jgi:hypothetical protein
MRAAGPIAACTAAIAALTFPTLAQQTQETPRNLPQVQCKLNETALGVAAGSWARTLDIAQDEEARLRIEVANASTSAAYANQLLADLASRIADQESEIFRLKAELAKTSPQ